MPVPVIPLNAAGLDIENESMRIIDAEVPEPRPFDETQWPVVRRMIHASADFELMDLVRFHPLAVAAALKALQSGCAVITDTRMALAGLSARLYDPLGCQRYCLINDPRTLERANVSGSTRAAAAVDVAAAEHRDAIWVVGNAPTALLRLLELVDAGRVVPALVIGMPVGFVQAAESKQALLENESIASILVRGRKGGSALAAAALNALAGMALQAATKPDPEDA
ncbi:precorrin-8X methylmutase [Desulfonatronum thiosulfatophilum]|uniref:Precorrin-8X methylmutase n=1 Tax=Desulfonatronum thiosulfatophilum TaxID=617002 RepID=A0A1G6AVU9_9BACT|nr:precorrin-8X methylmutase [Desulfonatronum thiosulfatophilum]SDB12462.1 precorrin-8X methylmutase [Desulfonatronum thiosulfatophilum]